MVETGKFETRAAQSEFIRRVFFYRFCAFPETDKDVTILLSCSKISEKKQN